MNESRLGSETSCLLGYLYRYLIGVCGVFLTGHKDRKRHFSEREMNSRSCFSLDFPDAGHVLIPLSSRGSVNFLKSTKGDFSRERVRGGLVTAQVRFGWKSQSAAFRISLKMGAVLTGVRKFIAVVISRVEGIFLY